MEGLLSRALNCSFHRSLALLFSFNRVVPSADSSGVVHGIAGLSIALMELMNIFEFLVLAVYC